jgi:hypothetical protein
MTPRSDLAQGGRRVRRRVSTRKVRKAMKALQVLAGPIAARRLRERGLRPEDIRAIPAAAAGPKGLVLHPIDRFLFGQWLPRSEQVIHLLGASIGAWRLACAARADADRALAQMAAAYIAQHYDHAPGHAPHPAHVSERFEARVRDSLGGGEHEVLAHPRLRLHVFASRGRRLLARTGGVRTPLGVVGAFASNAVSRRALGGLLERVIFSDPRTPLPVPTHDYRTAHVPLSEAGLVRGVLASCSIPFWFEPVLDIAGAPPGPYWDGGLTDYHLHLDYAPLAGAEGDGLVLYPHYQQTLVPGWLDKALRHRHRASARLANVVLLAPAAQWIASLPNGKLPDRADFRTFVDDDAARIAAWTRAVAESVRLADEFEALTRQPSVEALPLP